MADPLVHVTDRLTQIALVIVSAQQPLLHKPFGDFAHDAVIQPFGPDGPLQDRQDPDQDACVAVLDGIGNWSSRVGRHDSMMPGLWSSVPSPADARLER